MQNKYQDAVAKFRLKIDSLHAGKELEHVSDAQLEEIEAQLGYEIPKDYRQFLSDYGGCNFSDVFFPITKDGHLTQASVFFFYSALEDNSKVTSYYKAAREDPDLIPINLYPGLSLIEEIPDDKESVEWPKGLLPIACDMGGNQICLVLSGSKSGAVFQWMNAPGTGDQNVYLIADSFDEFIKLLQIDEQ